MENNDSQHRRLYVGMHDGVCAVTSVDGGRTWEQGPITPLDHAAARVSFSPAEPQTAYLAAYEAGVYRTDDGGFTWRHLSSYPSDYAHSVVAHPKDHKRIYIGSEPASIFHSGDGGDTWEECAGFRAVPESDQWWFHSDTRDSHVRDLRMAPGDPLKLYAGIEVGGMVHSRDGGVSWKQQPGIETDVHFVSLSMARPDRVYVATAIGPYRSDDGGQGWEMINNGLQQPYTVQITAAPDDANLVLMSVSSGPQRRNPLFYRSTTAGREWRQIEAVGSNGDMVVAIDWDPHDHRRVYVGTDGGNLFLSNDRGESWEQLPVKLPSIAVSAMVVA